MTSPVDPLRRPAGGFTLLEMIIVLVVLALVAGGVVGRGPVHSHALDVRAAVSDMVAALRGARGRAIAGNRAVLVVVNGATGRMTVDGLPALERELTPEKLSDAFGKIGNEQVDVSMPRFRMTGEFQLKSTLVSMGMPNAFQATANFSGMTGKDDLKISNVIHKAFVEVNEEGTEAAAATATVMGLATAMGPRETMLFRADHPFLFVIRDEMSGAILFMGRFVKPN